MIEQMMLKRSAERMTIQPNLTVGRGFCGETDENADLQTPYDFHSEEIQTVLDDL